MPKLRFPEFSGEWKTKKFENLAQFSKGKNISKDDISKDGIPCIRYGELYTTYNEKITEPVSKTNLNPAELVLSKENDIIIPTSGETAIDIATASCIMNRGIAIGGDITIIKTNGNGLFYSYYLNSQRNKIARLAQGASVVHLYATYLKKIDLNIPDTNEQNKIASFLSKVDEKIGLLEKKMQLWETYKKGMMQQIFSQKLRFKDKNGENYPEWESIRMDQIAHIWKGFTPSTSKPELWNGGIPWLSIADMNQGKYLQTTSRTITKEASRKKRIIPKNSLLMSFKLTLGRVGILNKDMYSNEAICNFEWTRNDINTDYMYYYLSSIDVRSFGSQAAKGITLNNESLGSIIVKIPALKEQNKIATFLSSIDSRVEQLNKELQINKEFKKGLLQQMFC